MSNALMKREYQVNVVDGVFFVMDGAGERVSTCLTEEAARAEIAACEKNDMLHQHAKSLVQAAVETMMREHGLAPLYAHKPRLKACGCREARRLW